MRARATRRTGSDLMEDIRNVGAIQAGWVATRVTCYPLWRNVRNRATLLRVASHAQRFEEVTYSVTPVAARTRLSYVALGLVWPAAVAVAFFVVGWDDPPPSLGQLVYAGLEVWAVELAVTVPAFAALWLAGRLVFPRLGASPPGVARLFFWTSLIGSPLALVFLLSI